MIHLVYGEDTAVQEFVSRQTKVTRGFWPNAKTIGVADERGKLIAGLLYHHWNPEAGTIVMSGAASSPRWLTRPVLKRIFDYPFVDCGCQMMIMQPSARDLRLQRQLAVIGFAFVRVNRLCGRDHDGVIATMTEEDWRASPFNRHPHELREAA